MMSAQTPTKKKKKKASQSPFLKNQSKSFIT